MNSTIQRIDCDEVDCGASISLHLSGAHDLGSTAQALSDVARAAGWCNGRCPDHRSQRGDFERVKIMLVPVRK